MSSRRLRLACLILSFPALAWAEDDLFLKSVADVSDGELRFLTRLPDKPVHHHQNRITIDDASLADGWVRLQQCHTHLDVVPSSQVVYREDFVRKLRVTHAEGIGRAWVEGPSVQLADVGHDARLCIEAETRALSARSGDSYFLRNGPYMRRFLDGYYPMRVSLSVHIATPRLRFRSIDPPPQPGFSVTASAGDVDIEATFEGRLRIESRFELVQ
ncbi:MAG: hypothetical protein AB1831_05010 [Pseudomonadota bacterium]